MKRVHIDTDPGIDDLLALALLFAAAEFEVVSLSTVAGNVALDRVSENASAFLSWAGHATPLGAGAAQPLKLPAVDAAWFHGENGRGGIPLPAGRAVSDSAERLLLESLSDRDLDAVIALGPLTNIAELLTTEPKALANVPLIWMGGALDRGNITPHAEFNAFVDPHAVQQVLDADVSLTIIGLNVTDQIRLSQEELQSWTFADKSVSEFVHHAVRALSRVEAGAATLHDPAAVIAACDPSLFRWESLGLHCECNADKMRGAILRDTRTSRRAAFALDVDAAAVKTAVLKRLAAWELGT